MSGDIVSLARSLFAGRRGLVIMAIVIGLAAIAMNWSWFVAVGLAPIMIFVLPCFAFCGLGFCRKK